MIQRKQTIFLFVALVLSIICLCLPLCTFTFEEEVGLPSTMYNLWIVNSNGGHDFSVWALFAILLITCPISLFAIFAFHNRITQSRLCLFNILLIIGWYAVLLIFILGFGDETSRCHPSITIIFPLIAAVFYFLSRRSILKDEALVRAADRIR